MPDAKLTALNEVSVPSLSDILYAVSSPGSTPASEKISISRLLGMLSQVAGGRLTTESGVSVSTSDRTAQSTLYYTTHTSNLISLYDGTRWVLRQFTEPSLTISGLTNNTNYDCFLYWNGSDVVIEIQAWRNSGQAITGATNASLIVITANSHGLSNGDEVYISGVLGNTAANGTWIVANVTANTFELSGSTGNGSYLAGTGWFNARIAANRPVRRQGVWTKNGDPTRRFVGTFRTTGVTTTEDSCLRRFVWNADNRVPRLMLRQTATAFWTYLTANTWRQANSDSANQIEYVVGLNDREVTAFSRCLASHSVAGNTPTGVGVDSTTVNSAQLFGGYSNTTATSLSAPRAEYSGFPGFGYHRLVWIERTSIATATYYGIESGNYISGISGRVDA
jgi:hypothetical protein